MTFVSQSIEENFEYKGLWFLPEKINEKIQGTLTYDAENGSYLELMGTLEDFNGIYSYGDSFKPAIILGDTTNGMKITLYKCFREKRNISGGGSLEKYSLLWIFVGAHFFAASELKFNSVCATLHNLDEWLNISGFEIKSKTSEKFELRYKSPKTIDFELSRGLKGSFRFGIKQNITFIKQTLEQVAQFVIESTETEIKFEDFFHELSHFRNFLTIGTREYSYPISIVFQKNDLKEKIKDREYRRPIILFYKNPKVSRIGHSQKSIEFLFFFKDTKSIFKKIIYTWYMNKDLVNLPVSLLVDNFSKAEEFNENNFLNIIQAIETFHRRFRKNEVLTKEKYKKKKEEILSKVSKKHRDWLAELLNFANEPNLHMRLEGLIKGFSNKTVKRIIVDLDKFIKDTKNSRNYYVHYDKKMEKKALRGRELFYLSKKLEVILICAILHEVGFSKQRIEKLLERNTKYRLLNLLIEKNK